MLLFRIILCKRRCYDRPLHQDLREKQKGFFFFQKRYFIPCMYFEPSFIIEAKPGAFGTRRAIGIAELVKIELLEN